MLSGNKALYLNFNLSVLLCLHFNPHPRTDRIQRLVSDAAQATPVVDKPLSRRSIPVHHRDGRDYQSAAPGAGRVQGCTPGFAAPIILPSAAVSAAEVPPCSPSSIGPRVLLPEFYHGKLDTLQDFLTILSFYFMHNLAAEQEKIATLFSCLGSKALQWVAAVWEKQGEETHSGE